MEFHQGIGYEKACRLSNTCHTDVVPALSLPLLPLCFGASDLAEDPSQLEDRDEFIDQAGGVAELLNDCDVSYLKLKRETRNASEGMGDYSRLYNEVLKYNPQAFDCSCPGPLQERHLHSQCSDIRKPIERYSTFDGQTQKDHGVSVGEQPDQTTNHDPAGSSAARKLKFKKKEINSVTVSTEPNVPDQQNYITTFCDTIDDICGKSEMHDNFEDPDASSIPLTDIKFLINEIVSARSKKILHLIPVDTLLRLVNVLDIQIQYGQGLSITENEYRDFDAGSIILSALESTHAVLAVMTYQDMPKQIYKEELIERIIEFTRHQIMDTMATFNPSMRTPVKTTENGDFDGDEEDDVNTNSVDRKRRYIRNSTMRKTVGNKVSSAVHAVIQKLCSVLGFLKDLLSVERLSDSCILQLVKTSFSTFLVESVQLLQLKSIDLICGVYASYTQHRSFLIDETVQLLRKLQSSKRTLRSYHLPDEEHKQIQMVTALLIQLVQFSTDVPEILKASVTLNAILDASTDASYLTKSHDAAKDACCNFWTSVLQRFTSVKPHEVSECKIILESLVNDLLITLNLPEYPASALILEVLCVLLLQNAGPKSKDMSARSVAIDLLGTIAARLKHETAICSRNKFWILHELVNNKTKDMGEVKDACSVCFKGKGLNIVCSVCQRCFHADCLGNSGPEMLRRDWSCHLCACKKQLSILLSYCNIQQSNDGKKTTRLSGNSGTIEPINPMEVVQQLLLNYLNETGTQDDSILFTCWFYNCLWFKDVPQSQDKIIYWVARIKAKEFLRDTGSAFSLPRDWAKKICLALAQHSSFFRGFDIILNLLLASMKENSSALRAKALRAISLIVEADPEVLCDIRVQSGVEGRFCDSAISVREAALELVGRHIASHPDVGLKYFEKVAERIQDTGVSVRKRSIKIIRDLCISGQNFSQGTSAFIKIISRVTDEESSIRDLVCKTFYELWFEEPSESQTQFVGDGSSVPMEVATKTEQMVDVLRKMSNQNLFVSIIKRNLALDFLPQSAKASGISAYSLPLVRRRCELICKRLLERILQVEERNSNEEEVRALPYVLALHAFCLVDPTLCTPSTDPSKFVVTLQPYLKHQVNNSSIAKLLESIIFVVNAVLPLLRKPPMSVIEDLQQDLINMIVRHSYMSVVHASIRCLCSLGKIADKGISLVENLLLLFFKKLDTPGDNKQLIGRSLFCLGKILRYGNKLIDASNPQHAHIVKSLSMLKKFLLMEDFSIKVRALQALGHVLIAKPEYMLDMDIRRIIEASLSSSTDSRLKLQILQNLYEYLVDAESQFGSDGEAKTETEYPESNGSVPVAAGAGDTNICGGIIQLYWDSILERCLDVNDQVRATTLKIVEIVLRQGLVHPITCVPCLVALETDPLEVNTKLAHHLLINMNEKYPAFFESRLGDGLQLAFRFYQSVMQSRVSENSKGKSDGNAIAYVRPGISRIYRLIRGNRNSRNKFMHSIVRKFESGIWNYSPVPFLVYCAEMLASIPFSIPDEPLYLIYDINRVIQRRAGGLEANMKNWSSLPLQEDSAGISEEVRKKIQADCHDAIALQLLLKLKRHLKIVYGLDDSRCQAFSLKEHPKPGETLSRQSIPFNLSDIPTSLPDSYQDMLQSYQEFKAVLKDDTMDYATYTAEIKRKRPTPTPRISKVQKPAAAAAPSRPRAHANKRHDDDEDDDDDDETWTGGARRLDFGDQKVDGGRVTRQRLRVT